MSEPMIAIAGSADPQRTDYEPAVEVAGARQAARDLGVELAKRRFRIIVYHYDFIEGDVVAGYASVAEAPEKGIVVRYPQTDANAARFPEAQQRPDLFEFKADGTSDWEASYYRSLRDADGVILIGGGTSVVITGHLALGFRIPVLALASFGGGAQKVRNAINTGQDLPTDDDTNVMAAPTWSEDSASSCVNSLQKQRGRRDAELKDKKKLDLAQQREKSRRHWLAAILMLLSLSVVISAFLIDAGNFVPFLLLLFFGPCVSGASGSMTRMVWMEAKEHGSTMRTGVLGLIAGAISAFLYFIAQFVANPALLKAAHTQTELPTSLIFLAVITGWIAGFTSDRVFAKVDKTDVARTNVVACDD